MSFVHVMILYSFISIATYVSKQKVTDAFFNDKKEKGNIIYHVRYFHYFIQFLLILTEAMQKWLAQGPA